MFVNNVWATSSFATSECALDEAMNLFLWCPADRRSAVFQEKDKEVHRANNAALMGTNKGKVAKEVPLLFRCTCLLDMVSALLFMSAAARTLFNEVEDHAPTMAWLNDFAASTIFTEEIQDALAEKSLKEELLSHYPLHELQEISCAYVKDATHRELCSLDHPQWDRNRIIIKWFE